MNKEIRKPIKIELLALNRLHISGKSKPIGINTMILPNRFMVKGSQNPESWIAWNVSTNTLNGIKFTAVC